MNVAWIGLGNMGLSTAKLVAAAGFQVKAFDINPPAEEDARGLILAPSAREAAEDCDLLCIAVFSDEQVDELLTGSTGLFSRLKDGAVVAIFTTGTVDAARALANAAPKGVAVIDTCFSRRMEMLPSGKMNLLVGGEAAALDRCRAVFAPFTHAIYHLGAVGAGRAVKLVNNILWVGHIQLASDALRLAKGFGLEPREIAKVILECSGASDVLNIFTEPNVEQSLKFMRPYMIKDASAAAEAARAAGVELGTLADIVGAYTDG